MYTTINEMIFSKHYVNDGNNSRLNRIRNVEIITNLQKPDIAAKRLKSALFNLALFKLDSINNDNYTVYTIPNITFIENGKNIVATLKGDNGIGNTFVFICENNIVVTAYLSRTNNIQEIKQKAEDHLNKKVNSVISLNNNDKTIINLDINDIDFLKQYPPFTTLKNNKMDFLTPTEKLTLEEDKKILDSIPDVVMSSGFKFHNLEANTTISEKEFVVGTPGEDIYVYVNGEPKIKTIRRAYRDDRETPAKMYLEFERTLKPLELKVGDTFIIKPKVENEETRILKDMFNIQDGQDVYFSGKIIRLTFYKKEKTKTVEKIGIIIKPTQVLELNN